MKIIDLLINIANGEGVPNKIKHLGKEYIYDFNIQDYRCNDTLLFNTLFSKYRTGYFINDEVEIIEEKPKPITKESIEALGYACGEIQKCFTNGWKKSLENKPLKEDKKIEKIDLFEDLQDILNSADESIVLNAIHKCLTCEKIKVNELIDKVNSLENKQ